MIRVQNNLIRFPHSRSTTCTTTFRPTRSVQSAPRSCHSGPASHSSCALSDNLNLFQFHVSLDSSLFSSNKDAGPFSCGTQRTAKQSSGRIANCRCGRRRLKLLWNLQRSYRVPDRARRFFPTCRWIFIFLFPFFSFLDAKERFNSFFFLFFFLKRNLFLNKFSFWKSRDDVRS